MQGAFPKALAIYLPLERDCNWWKCCRGNHVKNCASKNSYWIADVSEILTKSGKNIE